MNTQEKRCLFFDNVRKEFISRAGGHTVVALSDVSFAVDSGEYVCLLGRSGCGKSTLLSIIAGLESPDSGQAFVKGQLISGPDRHRMLMFQADDLFPWLNVLDNVLYGLKLVEGLSKEERLERAHYYLDLVGLANFTHFRTEQLSGGMKQRVSLARALAPDPDVLLMDEPFSALDAMTREQLYSDMQNIWTATKKTILMVTHNAREAACLGTRVVLMDRGKIVGDVPVNLPYPRTMNDSGTGKTAAHISLQLQNMSAETVIRTDNAN